MSLQLILNNIFWNFARVYVKIINFFYEKYIFICEMEKILYEKFTKNGKNQKVNWIKHNIKKKET